MIEIWGNTPKLPLIKDPIIVSAIDKQNIFAFLQFPSFWINKLFFYRISHSRGCRGNIPYQRLSMHLAHYVLEY